MPVFKTITSIEGAQQQHRAMTASPQSSLLSLCQRTAPARVLTLQVPCHPSHLPAPVGPSAETAPSCPARSTRSSQPPIPRGPAVVRDVGAQTTPAAARHRSRHSYGTCLGPADEAGAGGGSRNSTVVGWGRFLAASQRQHLLIGGTGLLPARVIVQIPPCRCSLPPPSRQPQERAVAQSPLPCTPRAGRGPQAGGRDRLPHQQHEGLPEGLTGRRVTDRCHSMSEGAVGTTSCLHRAGREPAAAVGLPGYAGDPRSQHHWRDTHSVLSLLLNGCHLRLTTRTNGNQEEVYQVTLSLEMPHRDVHLFFPM